MTEKEILKKVYQKAVKNGWGGSYYSFLFSALKGLGHKEYYTWIFDHDFAKAFWGWRFGKESFIDDKGNTLWRKIPRWRHHLQQMVLEENPIKYLERFLNQTK